MNLNPNDMVFEFNKTVKNILKNKSHYIHHETLICYDRDTLWINNFDW